MFFAYTHPRSSRPFLKFAFVSCLTLVFLLAFTFLAGGHTNTDSTLFRYSQSYSWLSSNLGISDSRHGNADEEDRRKHQRTFNIALTERAGHHDEVLGAFLYTLATSSRISNTTVYRNSYRYKFSEIIKPFYPYPPLAADVLFDALNTTFSNLNSSSLMQKHDALVLSSCDQTLPKMLPSLLASLSLLPKKHDFRILCIIHDAAHPPHDLARIAGPLVELGLVTFFVLSDAASWMVRESVFELASSASGSGVKDEVNGWDRVPVEVFVPIFPAPLGKKLALESGDTVYGSIKARKRVLSSAIVQGNIDPHRRDYVSLFRDLEEALERDPAFWGYKPLSQSSSGAYEALPLTSSSPPSFVLHLAGSLLPPSSPTQSTTIPSPLVNVVKIHPSLSYPDFFSLMNTVDLVLPAFARPAYYKSSASSTVPASVIAEVPILATRRLLNAYQYLDSRTSILRPAGMKEIEAVRLLRMGILPDEYLSGKRRRDLLSPELDDWDEEERSQESMTIDFAGTSTEPESNSYDGTEGSTVVNMVEQFDNEATCTKESVFQTHSRYLSTDGFDGDSEGYQENENEPGNLSLTNEHPVGYSDTTHPRTHGRSLLNSHSSRSLRPGAGSLLPRFNRQKGPIPPPQNHPQNTQDRRALQMFTQNLKRRHSLSDGLSAKKKKWDGDMNTLISRADIRAMHNEVYSRNEQVLLRAFEDQR